MHISHYGQYELYKGTFFLFCFAPRKLSFIFSTKILKLGRYMHMHFN